ncbi:uncharacterized protein BX663DRAFT_53650 [Cokeromyces recurvatus]|uniref:uncharacterized protein n=1 Tax=Cokeromyces recurvatus TaxID=90255 RepID=UPI002220D87B|nr:uncharacterized protein BX663DRAFT_53650 [Cokeromyces recurvatus]KAI7902866.1 hypothetical protein BX663DRAFT_53650 [Cokeromyces recurvatus]
MVHMRCQHLHLEALRNTNHRILQQWKMFLFSYHQLRQASSLVVRSKLATHDIDLHRHLRQLKSSGKQRIPIQIASKINKHLTSSSIAMAIHGHLQHFQYDEAWKLFDDNHTRLPRLTARMLLDSLLNDTLENRNCLKLNFGKLQQIYLERLNVLATHNTWDTHETGLIIELYGLLDQLPQAERIFRKSSKDIELCNQLLSVYVQHLKDNKHLMAAKIKALEQDVVVRRKIADTTFYNLLLMANMDDVTTFEQIAQEITEHNRTTYHILLEFYLKRCHTRHGKEKVQEFLDKINPNRTTFKRLLNGLADHIKYLVHMKQEEEMAETIKSVNDLYRSMIDMGYQPDTEILNILLKCYTRANNDEQIKRTKDMFFMPKKKGKGGNSGKRKKKAKSKTVAYKVMPDTYTFNTLMHYYLANNNNDLAFIMYDSMVRLKLDPDTVTYGNFIGHYAEKGEVIECLKYLDVMRQKGIPVNSFIYNALLNCSLKYPQEADLLKPQLRSLLANQPDLIDQVSSNIQLTNYKGDHKGFIDLLEQVMTVNNGRLETRTYNTILHTVGKLYYKPRNQDHILASLDLENIIASLDRHTQLEPDIYTYALKIRNAVYLDDISTAEHIFKDMIDAGIKPNAYVFSHLIYGYSKRGKMDSAEQIMQHMSHYAILPNVVHYACLIKGYSDASEFDKAYETFRTMLKKPIHGDVVLYTILASMFLKSRGSWYAIELIEGIQNAGMKMDGAALTVLIEAYASTGSAKISKIQELCNELRKHNWLDSRAITTSIMAYYYLKQPKAALDFWNTLKSDHVQLSTTHYNSMLKTLIQFGDGVAAGYSIAKEIFFEMPEPDSNTLDLMIWAAHEMSDGEMIRKIWTSKTSKKDRPLMARSYYALMKGLNDNNMARSVFEEYQKLQDLPNSTSVWINFINKLAVQQGFKK